MTLHQAIRLALAAASVAAVLIWVDLSPRVEADFFFSEEDPQLQASLEISRRFPSPQQLIVRAAAPDIESAPYRTTVRELGAALRDVPGVLGLNSIATDDPARSPLWGRLLPTPDGQATNLIARVDDRDPDLLVPGVEEAVSRFDGPDFELEVSGVPYIIELIRRNLFRDLVVFSSAALLVFGLVVGVVYRTGRIIIGTLASCLIACAITLLIAQVLGIAIGLLTANIVTIVFVLTLSHIVFLTSNWRLSAGGSALEGGDPVREAVGLTLWPSFWCMMTTMLGFLSLLVASARPLRELGIAGALGTATAMAVAYLSYPAFLRGTSVTASPVPSSSGGVGRYLPTRNAAVWLVGLAALAIVAGLGIRSLNTDPGLLSYFAAGTELRDGLEDIDRDGGSSSLNVVVRDTEGQRIDTDHVNAKMWALHDAVEADSSVGVVLSPAVLLGHARTAPLAGFLSWSQLLDILESPGLDRVALSFVTQDRDQGLFFLRMRESGRTEARADVIARIQDRVRESGFEVVLVGGQYDLQRQLGRLIKSSLRIGLGGLVLLFVGIAVIVSRSARVTIAMVGSLVAIPLLVLGTMGHVGIAIGIIASPAANVALAMGVDSMIHLTVRARRLTQVGSGAWEAWMTARDQLWQPVLGAALIICTGFGIFALSTFPPTQRFGLAVILGTATAATMSLIALPFGAAGGRRA